MSRQKRPYRLKQRAEAQERTRRRITEAAVELHGSIGPARTTISAVANRAGVQRTTFYRHFPDEESLFAACSAHWLADNPLPDVAAWAAIRDPDERLRTALAELYSYYRRGEPMIANLVRDEGRVEALSRPMARRREYFAAVREALVRGRGRGLRGGRRERLRAAVGHAIDFATWRSLTRDQGLDDAEAVDLMTKLVTSAAEAGRHARA
jgi:AcrR family transcriptional regulator